jgi:hypothetical protein
MDSEQSGDEPISTLGENGFFELRVGIAGQTLQGITGVRKANFILLDVRFLFA